MKKKFFSILLCITMLTCLVVGCKSDDKSSDDSKAEQSQSIEYETIAPPEGGWTAETVASTIRLCGKPIELPFTVGSLGEGFEFKNNTGIVTYTGHESFLTLFVKTEKSDDLYSKTVRKIASCEYYSDDDFQNCFIINGIGISSSREEVIAAFGEPDFQNDWNFEYNAGHENSENSEKNIVRFYFGDLDIVQAIFVTLVNE